jgi:hypothetical protein
VRKAALRATALRVLSGAARSLSREAVALGQPARVPRPGDSKAVSRPVAARKTLSPALTATRSGKAGSLAAQPRSPVRRVSVATATSPRSLRAAVPRPGAAVRRGRGARDCPPRPQCCGFFAGPRGCRPAASGSGSLGAAIALVSHAPDAVPRPVTARGTLPPALAPAIRSGKGGSFAAQPRSPVCRVAGGQSRGARPLSRRLPRPRPDPCALRELDAVTCPVTARGTLPPALTPRSGRIRAAASRPNPGAQGRGGSVARSAAFVSARSAPRAVRDSPRVLSARPIAGSGAAPGPARAVASRPNHGIRYARSREVSRAQRGLIAAWGAAPYPVWNGVALRAAAPAPSAGPRGDAGTGVSGAAASGGGG